MALLHDRPLDPAAMILRHHDPGHGGVVVFIGRVRDVHAGREVVALEYSAYAEMAEAEAAAIVQEAQARWPVQVSLGHRVGRLSVGEVAVVVVTSGGHRDECYQANRWLIDTLKARVPIWKREWYPGGASEWIDPTAARAVP